MGKACLILAAVMLALFLFPKNQANGASLENPLQRGVSEMDTDKTANVDGAGGGMDYDYAFLNQPDPSFGGLFPGRSRTMKRHDRLMKRLRRYANENGSNPAQKIPAGCCSCGDHLCFDSMCHGK